VSATYRQRLVAELRAHHREQRPPVRRQEVVPRVVPWTQHMSGAVTHETRRYEVPAADETGLHAS